MSSLKRIGLISSGKHVQDSKRLSELKAQYPDAEIISNTDEIMNDETIQLVFISSPSRDNLDMAGEALRWGKHVRII
jgi:predicted dehydrogenase